MADEVATAPTEELNAKIGLVEANKHAESKKQKPLPNPIFGRLRNSDTEGENLTKFSRDVLNRAAADIQVDPVVLESARNPDSGDIDPYEDMLKSAEGSSAVDVLKQQDSAGKNTPELLPPIEESFRFEEIVSNKFSSLLGTDRFRHGYQVFLDAHAVDDESWGLFQVNEALENIDESPDDETNLRKQKLETVQKYLILQEKKRDIARVHETDYHPENFDKDLENMTILDEQDKSLRDDMAELFAARLEHFASAEDHQLLVDQYKQICEAALTGNTDALRVIEEHIGNKNVVGVSSPEAVADRSPSNEAYDSESDRTVDELVKQFFNRVDQTTDYLAALDEQNAYHDLADKLKLLGLSRQQKKMLETLTHYNTNPRDTELAEAIRIIDEIDPTVLESHENKHVADDVKKVLIQKLGHDIPNEYRRAEQSQIDAKTEADFAKLKQEIQTEARQQVDSEVSDRKAENLRIEADYIGDTIRKILQSHNLDTTTHSPSEMLQRLLNETQHANPTVHLIIDQASKYPTLMPLFAQVVTEQQALINESKIPLIPELSNFHTAFLDLVKKIDADGLEDRELINKLINEPKSIHPELSDLILNLKEDGKSPLVLETFRNTKNKLTKTNVSRMPSNIPDSLKDHTEQLSDLLSQITYDKSTMSPQDLLQQVQLLASGNEALQNALLSEMENPDKTKDLTKTLEDLKRQQEWDQLIEGADGLDMETVLAGLEDVSQIQELIAKVNEQVKKYGDEGLENMNQLVNVVTEAVAAHGKDLLKTAGKAVLIMLVVAAVLAIGGVVIGTSMMGGGGRR